jgi:hypothetical protein
LADNLRVLPDVKDAQKKFLEKVVTTIAITFGDDMASNQWSFGYYLFNAFYRLKNARNLAGSLLANDADTLDYCFRIYRVASLLVTDISGSYCTQPFE